jgi:hypothetical protein
MQVSTLRPGLLVSLKTSLSGNVSYTTRDIEPDHIESTGERRARWETERTIANPQEHEEAIQVRGRARSLVIAHCASSSFGLLCPRERRDALLTSIKEARELANAFNARATCTQIHVNVILGEIAADDAEALLSINSEMRSLLSAMETGLQRLDAKAVRDAADKARALGAMLSPYAQGQVQQAIEVARSAARRISKAGETAAIEIDAATLRTIRASRTAFLDLDPEQEVSAPTVTAGRAVDLDPDPAPIVRAAAAVPQFAFEM